jgi:hypothetical protein
VEKGGDIGEEVDVAAYYRPSWEDESLISLTWCLSDRDWYGSKLTE